VENGIVTRSSKVGQLVACHVFLLVFNAIMGGYINKELCPWSPRVEGLCSRFLAVPLAQVSLLALWMVFGTGRLASRLPLAFVLFAIACLGLNLSLAGMAPYGVALLGVQLLMLQLVFWPLSIRLGLMSSKPDVADSPTVLSRRQFALQEVFIWTTALAVLSGCSGWLLREGDFRSWWAQRGPPDLVRLAVTTSTTVLLTLTAMWAAWSLRSPRAVVATAALVWLSAACVQWLVNRLVAESSYEFPWLGDAWSTTGVQFLALLASLLILRADGYRLKRTGVPRRDVTVPRRAAAVSLLGLQACLLLAVGGGSNRYLYYPLVLSQTSVMSLWLALGRSSFTWRLPLVVAWLATLGAWRTYVMVDRGWLDWVWCTLGLLDFFGSGLLVLVPFWAMRIVSGLRLASVDGTDLPQTFERERSLARSILLWTSGGVVLLGLAWCLVWRLVDAGRLTLWSATPYRAQAAGKKTSLCRATSSNRRVSFMAALPSPCSYIRTTS
jgi:hypothetical protein